MLINPNIDLSFLDGMQLVAVLGGQWGDEGKGMWAELLAYHWADIILRTTGGGNAGHTGVIGDLEIVTHQLPVGAMHGKPTYLCRGMTIDPSTLLEEIAEVEAIGGTLDQLRISLDANVVMPYHLARDGARNTLKAGGIGSTGKGIGPSYADEVARWGITFRDLLGDRDNLVRKIKKAGSSGLYGADQTGYDFNVEEILSIVLPSAERLRVYCCNVEDEIETALAQGKKAVIEGAQGFLLSYRYGTKPYVTSSCPSVLGTLFGLGIDPKKLDMAISGVKFPYMTRVGKGPFPTELGGLVSAEYCNAGLEHNAEYELEKYGIPYKVVDGKIKYDHDHPNINKLTNSEDPFERGVAFRLIGGEYGATTKRPRRTGWTDLALLKSMMRINGSHMILTKVDVPRGPDIKYGVGYKQSGVTAVNLKGATPVYKTVKGFDHDISGVRQESDLPSGVREGMDLIRDMGGIIHVVSVGPDRYETFTC
jgi:adenylosuccinate synthase